MRFELSHSVIISAVFVLLSSSNVMFSGSTINRGCNHPNINRSYADNAGGVLPSLLYGPLAIIDHSPDVLWPSPLVVYKSGKPNT